jgi:DNA ligase 1
LRGIKKVEPEIFTPILMMKAQRLPDPKEIIAKIGEGFIEPKYDGFRLQAHYDGKTVKLFSRGLEDVTYMYPDIVEGVKKEVKVQNIIFEGEAIGFDPYTGNFLPFQETVQRKRKYDIAEKAQEIPLRMFAFELLYLNGKSHLNTPLKDRIKILSKHIKVSGDIFKDTLLLSPEEPVSTTENLVISFDVAISKGLEGIMVKRSEGLYQPGARAFNWIKYKRSQSTKIEDTIDCLVMGYDKGKGKRSGFGIGAFLAGIYDKKEDMFRTVAKIGTGLSDDEWREIRKRADKLASDKKPALYDVDKLMGVDVWIKPEIVVEIQADEITRSPTHTAGRVMEPSKSGKATQVKTSGYALRFPRLKRFRDDKAPEDVTGLDEVEDMYREQSR